MCPAAEEAGWMLYDEDNGLLRHTEERQGSRFSVSKQTWKFCRVAK